MDGIGELREPVYGYTMAVDSADGELGYWQAVKQVEAAAEVFLRLSQPSSQEEAASQQKEEQKSNTLYYKELEDDRQRHLDILRTQQAMRPLYPNYLDPAVYQAQIMWLIHSL